MGLIFLYTFNCVTVLGCMLFHSKLYEQLGSTVTVTQNYGWKHGRCAVYNLPRNNFGIYVTKSVTVTQHCSRLPLVCNFGDSGEIHARAPENRLPRAGAPKVVSPLLTIRLLTEAHFRTRAREFHRDRQNKRLLAVWHCSETGISLISGLETELVILFASWNLCRLY